MTKIRKNKDIGIADLNRICGTVLKESIILER